MVRKMIDFTKLASRELKEFKNRYDAFIFDLDGCLVHLEAGPISGVKEALDEIAKNGKSIYVLTDNCLSTSKDIAARVNKLFPVIKKENVISSGTLAVKYLKEINFNKKVYIIGYEPGIVTELKESGFNVLYEETKKISVMDVKMAKIEKDVDAVLVAVDLNFSFLKLLKAVNFLADPQVLLIQAQIPDIVSWEPITPGVGALISAVKAGSRREKSIALGKGSEYCSKYLKSLGHPVEKCLFVGDNLSSDIVAGNMAGMDTMLTISEGICNLKDVKVAKVKNLELQIPTYYTESVANLINAFKID